MISTFQYLTQEDCIHAVGQGALAIECRQGDEDIMDLVWGLTHRETLLSCISERAVLSTLVRDDLFIFNLVNVFKLIDHQNEICTSFDLKWNLETFRDRIIKKTTHGNFMILQEGGCSAPVGCHAEIKDGGFYIIAGAWSLDGQQKVVKENNVFRV